MSTSRVQVKRTSTNNSPPTDLLPGELSAEMGTPTRLWLGVPAALDPSKRKLLAEAGHTHTAASITDFAEAVDDRTAALLKAGANVSLSYDDAGNALTISSAMYQLPSRLGPLAANLTDWNLAVESGWYSGSTVANSFTTGWVMGIVEAHGPAHITQTAHAFNADSAGNPFIMRRSCTNGVWEPWYKLQVSQIEQDARYAKLAHTHPITDVTGLRKELDDIKSAGVTPAVHGHEIDEIAGLQNALNHKANTNHRHDWSDISGIPVSATHTHAIADITGLQVSLNSKSNLGHHHPLGDITGAGELAAMDMVNTAHIKDHAVTGIKLNLGKATLGDLAFYDGTKWAHLAGGKDGQLLQSHGDTKPPSWVDFSSMTGGASSGWTQLATTKTAAAKATIAITGLDVKAYRELKIVFAHLNHNIGGENHTISIETAAGGTGFDLASYSQASGPLCGIISIDLAMNVIAAVLGGANAVSHAAVNPSFNVGLTGFTFKVTGSSAVLVSGATITVYGAK